MIQSVGACDFALSGAPLTVVMERSWSQLKLRVVDERLMPPVHAERAIGDIAGYPQ